MCTHENFLFCLYILSFVLVIFVNFLFINPLLPSFSKKISYYLYAASPFPISFLQYVILLMINSIPQTFYNLKK